MPTEVELEKLFARVRELEAWREQQQKGGAPQVAKPFPAAPAGFDEGAGAYEENDKKGKEAHSAKAKK